MSAERDARYLEIIVRAIRVCASYRPKMGRGLGAGISVAEFQELYGADPFYSWFGLGNPLMYAAHKAAGGMTSIYRQIGMGCERLFRMILRDELGLSQEDVCWSYSVTGSNQKARKLTLDGRIPIDRVADPQRRQVIGKWMLDSCELLGVTPEIASALHGPIFEVRQGYKSKDSKRQNADIANAATAYTQAYLPCCIVLSTQMDSDIVTRYRSEKWAILTGQLGGSALSSTYLFMREVIGYDLAGFFSRNANTLREEVDRVLQVLLRPE